MKQPYSINEILNLVEGRIIHQAVKVLEINDVIIDSRRVSDPDHSIFIAVKGERNNGHQFIYEAYNKGVRAFVVSEDINLSLVEEASVIKVTNTLLSLQLMAHKHLNNFHFPVVGITGSNGKTIVKEWLYQLLKDEFHIVKSPKSYNSQVGVPLSVWQSNPEHNFGIFEAGVSKPGEMAALEFMIQPTIGIFTNLGGAHDENFKNWEEKAKEKLRLFENSKVLIYCRDFLPIHNLVTKKSHFRELKTFTWSKKTQADLMIGKVSKTDVDSTIQGVYQNQFVKINVPFNDNASIENCINCWSTLLFLGYDSDWVNKRVKFLSPVAMRLELKEGLNNCSIINDYYNSDFSSLDIALDFMVQQKQHPDKTIILSDILQSGKKEEELYQSVADLLERKGVRKL
jgi:alanine racemase